MIPAREVLGIKFAEAGQGLKRGHEDRDRCPSHRGSATANFPADRTGGARPAA
jgi:hypothetical protein